MLEIFDNIWTYIDKNPVEFLCVTTNGCVKSDGSLVMGRGVAREAKVIFPGLDYLIGEQVWRLGNRLHVFYNVERTGIRSKRTQNIISFPTKTEDYSANSSLDLIRKSAKELNDMAVNLHPFTFLLPRPGCSNGGLDWEDVRPIIDFLPDNVLVIDRKPLR